MKIHRFIDNFDLSGNEIEITGEIAHQMAKVLKLEIGEQVELCDGKGTNAQGKIKTLSKNSTIVEIEKISKEPHAQKSVSLFCAVLKKENFELVVQKATECGVDKIIPIITTRTIKMGLNMERLQKIAREACEQSQRSILPEVLEPMSFEESFEIAKLNNINIIFDASGEDLLEKITNNKNSSGIWIGPEGGWTPEEIKKTEENNFKKLSLGKNILRAETAAIIATYLISQK
ncbi:MAG: RsmE family RNA methyltransferase [Candidatus Nomurabacteria bacterium]|nr:RsmE family RNA methyltransferase [Candidatus Nomurabacteria bacterium]